MTPEERMREILDTVKCIPAGKVSSYSCVGRQLSQPLSGLLVGRRLADMPDEPDVPWWRVVRADGVMVTFRRDVHIGMEQASRLVAEGVAVENEQVVDMKTHGFWFDEGG